MKKIALVVDDNPYIRGNIREILESSFFEVFEAKDGIESIDMFLEVKPSVVIMDINMPRLNGLEATTKIMEINPNANIAICSSMLFIPYYQKLAKKAGAKALISKPFTKLELISGLNELLEEMR
ncbi:response regulator [Streptobacillus ratti]|uniref:response regulator n=1 Tax=Streptobacillus ratti TaxID=1720557 RepID=UPI000933A196|nr:response regulator [Streptobacillus ratti]